MVFGDNMVFFVVKKDVDCKKNKNKKVDLPQIFFDPLKKN